MKRHLFTWFYRIALMAVLVVPGLALPHAMAAQAASPILAITATQADVSVSVHASGLPAGTTFIVRMGYIGTRAENGAAVGTTTSAADGTFDATYTIPTVLHGQATIAIRIDSSGGFYAYNWFTNKTNGSAPPATASTLIAATATPGPTATPLPAGSTSGAANMYITVVDVKQNDGATINAYGFPANIDFMVRIGPYYSFWRNLATVATVNSGKGGNFQFYVDLPASVKGVELVTVRMDNTSGSYHYVSYNAFTNVSGGSSGTVNPTSTPGSSGATSTPVPTTLPSNPNQNLPIAESGCKVTAITPTQSIPTRYDYDAVWTVTNTGTVDWDNHAVDYLYQSGTKMQKYTTNYDLPKRVKPGESVDLSADMLSPGDKGTYATTWVLSGDRGVLCTLPLTVVVK